jgi:hypothetical protein
LEREQGALQSVVDALSEAEQFAIAAKCTARQAELADYVSTWLGVDRIQGAPSSLVYARLQPWPMHWATVMAAASNGPERLDALRAQVADFDDKAIAALNYADGKRSIVQIARLVAAEYGEFSLGAAEALFSLLVEGNVVAQV